jgi:hypothetical protein
MVTGTLLTAAVVVGLAVAACQPSGAASSPPATAGSADGKGGGTPGASQVATPGASQGATPSASQGATPGASPAVTPDIESLRVTTTGWRTDFTKASVDLGDFRGGGPPKDGIPAVDSPVFETIDAARGWLTDRSPVISLAINGSARAYPLAILIWHEIVNDTLGGAPVVVTFCPLCNTALVFERQLDTTTHDFGTTGNLRYSDLVMYDRQTESWWQQATGEAIVGKLTGARLRFVPAQIVSLADFVRAHPDGDVLSRETGFQRDYGQNPYPGYDEAGAIPFLFEGVVDGRLAPKERVVTVGMGAEATAFPFSELRKTGVASGTADGQPVVVFWAPGTASALDSGAIDDGADIGATGVFRPELDGEPVTFRRDGGEESPITDLETGTTWSVTGLATAGPLVGAQLEPVPHGNHFWFAWAAFSPDTVIWTAP